MLGELFTCYIVGTLFGYFMSRDSKKESRVRITNATIDELIKSGYLRTRGEGDNLEILKYNES